MSIRQCVQLFQKLNLNTYKAVISTRRTNFATIHTTCRKLDLNEFFEDPSNLGKEEIKVGRSWKVEELRSKSNEDLHKLWYILLKEKNMLLTMEHYYKKNYELFPNPERIDKVEESMKNLETAVRERNRAYYELETGETGERPGRVIYDPIGLKHWRKLTQHYVPRAFNKEWKRRNPMDCDVKEVEQFYAYFKEKNAGEKYNDRKHQRRYVRGLLRRYPNLDLEYLQELYPDIDLQREIRKQYTRGHYEKREDIKL